MKRVVLFVLFAALGIGALLRLGGGLRLTHETAHIPTQRAKTPTRRTPNATPDQELTVTGTDGMPMRLAEVRGIVGYSRTETLWFEDPATGSKLEVRGWFTHRMACASIAPQQTTRGSNQAAHCTNVLLEVFHEPRTLDEARARAVDGNLDAVIEQRLVADEAVAIGPMAFSMSKDAAAKTAPYEAEDVVHLKGNVKLEDFGQGIEVTSDELTVYIRNKRIHRVEGRGPLRVVNEALVLTGQGIEMDQVEQGWARVRILKNPRLNITGVVRDKQGKSLLPLGSDANRPTEIISENEAILIRETAPRETRLRIRFPQGVQAEQTGGPRLGCWRT